MALKPNWTNLAGTILGYIRLGLTGVRLKDSSGVLAVRNATDAADAGITASTLVASGQVSLGGAAGAEALRAIVVASAVNRWQMGGGASTNGPYLECVGTATNLTGSYYTKGTGVHDFFTASGTRQFQVGHTASAVNYGKMSGGATGNAISFAAAGSDTNIGIDIVPKGTGAVTVSGPTIFSDQLVSRMLTKDCAEVWVDKGNSSTSTQTLDYTAGGHQKVTATGNHTVATSNWPPTGNLGVILFDAVNYGAYTITWPTINWVKADGSTTTTFSLNGVTLQSAGTDRIFLWSSDAGSTVYGKIMR